MVKPGKLGWGAGGSIRQKTEVAPWLVSGLISMAAVMQAQADASGDPAPGDPAPGITPGGPGVTEQPANGAQQNWNWHMQNTDIVQGDFGFPAKYSGPASLDSG